MGLSLYPTKGKPLIEYDFTKAEPIEYDQIKKGMLITHRDDDGFYIGIAEERSEYDAGTWVDDEGGYVADRECQNYVIPKKRQPLPTEVGARIMLTKDVPGKSDLARGKAGTSFTRNTLSGEWSLDGYSNSVPSSHFDSAEWVEVKVVPVGA